MTLYGNKLYKPYAPLFPTPGEIPLETTPVTINLPLSAAWIGLWIGALMVLIDEESFQEFEGGISRETTAEIFREALYDALLGTPTYQAPYWDDPEGDDLADPEDNPEYPFYENPEDFVIAGFVLYATGSPLAALEFWTTAKQFRLAFRKNDIGGIVKIFMDALQIGEVDTFSEYPSLEYFDVVSTGSTLRLEFPSEGTVTQVVRKRLWEQEITGNVTRWNEACMCFQSFDPFTETWYDNPQADPRINQAYLLAPRDTGDIRCDAAANMRGALEEILNQFFVFTETVQLINAIVGVIAVFQPGVGLLVALVAALIQAFIEIGVAAILFAFTTEVWDFVQCALYGQLDSEGQITQEGIDSALARIDAEFSGSVVGVCSSIMMSLLGVVGMNNAGATGTEVGNCESCGWCYTENFGYQEWGWVGYAYPVAPNWVLGSGWNSVNQSGGTYNSIEYTFPSPVTLTGATFTFSVAGGYDHSGSGTWIQAVIDGVDTDLTSTTHDPPIGTSQVTWADGGTPLENVSKIRLLSQINAVISTQIGAFQLEGVGDNPFGVPNNC